MRAALAAATFAVLLGACSASGSSNPLSQVGPQGPEDPLGHMGQRVRPGRRMSHPDPVALEGPCQGFCLLSRKAGQATASRTDRSLTLMVAAAASPTGAWGPDSRTTMHPFSGV